MNNLNAESECENHILPDNFMKIGIFTASIYPLTDWLICPLTDNLSFDRLSVLLQVS